MVVLGFGKYEKRAGWVNKLVQFDTFFVAIQYFSFALSGLPNGLIYLKGGNLDEEIASVVNKTKLFNISDFFSEEFFDTKKVVYVKRF